jgi:hypothetical protein
LPAVYSIASLRPGAAGPGRVFQRDHSAALARQRAVRGEYEDSPKRAISFLFRTQNVQQSVL